jgi:hypothetical protein
MTRCLLIALLVALLISINGCKKVYDCEIMVVYKQTGDTVPGVQQQDEPCGDVMMWEDSTMIFYGPNQKCKL